MSGLHPIGKSLTCIGRQGARFTQKTNENSVTQEIIIRVSGVRVPPPLPLFKHLAMVRKSGLHSCVNFRSEIDRLKTIAKKGKAI